MNLRVAGLLQAAPDQSGAAAGIEDARLSIGYQCDKSFTGFGIGDISQFIDQVVIIGRRPVVKQGLLVTRVVVDAAES